MSLQVGKYQLLDRIGSGGMAEIHLARVTGAAGFEKLVVVKRLLPDLAEEKEFVAQFVDEARLAATFSHGNIVTTFDFGEADGNYFIAMEYVEGKNLRRIADSLEKRGRKLPEAAAVHIIAEACRGLDYAHQRKDNSGRVLGIVHRDVSPQNLVVSYSGDVKVLDFGIAKSAAREYHTAAGIVKGKLRYMAPEQVTGEPIDGRADLFAAAVVLWELLYGRRVMPDMPDTELVEWVRKGEFIRPPDVDIASTMEIDAILAKALDVNPNNRYATCAELATALNRHNITRWPHWTSNELGKMLEAEFSDDARKEREWISHILGQMAAADAKVQVVVDVSIPASMKVVEAPSRDDIKTTTTPGGGVKRGMPTVLKPMEPDSGNTLSGFHVKAKDGVVPTVAPAAAPSRVGMLPPSRPASPDRGANTEISIPMIKGTPIVPSAAALLNDGVDEPDASNSTIPLPTSALPSRSLSPAKARPWLLVGGIGAGALAAAIATAFVLPSVIGGNATPVPSSTPVAMVSPVATVTPYLPTSPTPVTQTPTPRTTQVAMKTPVKTPVPTATKRVIVPTPTPAPTAAVATAAILSVNVTSGWASVYIDDKLVRDETPMRDLRIAPGKHVVTVMKGGRKRSETIVLRPGEQRTLLLDPP